MTDMFTFIPQIAGLGIELICSAIILAIAAEIIYFIHINPDVGYSIIGLLVFLIFFFLFIWVLVKAGKIIGKIYPKFKRFKDTSANITSYGSNLITILVLGFVAIMIPSLLFSYFWKAELTNFTILNIVILPILAAIIFWGLIYYSKKLLALNNFNKWKKFKPTKL